MTSAVLVVPLFRLFSSGDSHVLLWSHLIACFRIRPVRRDGWRAGPPPGGPAPRNGVWCTGTHILSRCATRHPLPSGGSCWWCLTLFFKDSPKLVGDHVATTTDTLVHSTLVP